jgi:ribosome-associated protein
MKAEKHTDTIMKEFLLEDRDYIELNDLLKVMGLFDSGGMAKTAISEGLVIVDGQVELRRRCKIRTGRTVKYADHTIIVK